MLTKLNTNLILLSNPSLIFALGADSKEILEETKKLWEACSYIKVPDAVIEKPQRRK